ncbi:MAG: hypothetical protein A2252_00915 [Elusimicrobia bacterium RIFOXYA2_FULL_39_19]|nr:MAG: hypothetical protein A2252_00915 [Elusimicrobia bacterium RIFOXYA2_FULL_39_19]
MKSKLLKTSILLFLAVLLTGCGANYKFKKAKKFEKQGYYIEAIQQYKNIAKKYPKNPVSPQALYYAGRVYQTKLKIYSESINTYLELIKKYPDSDIWVKMAKAGIFNSPCYFPLYDGNSWTEGDSQSLGKNMRVEWNSIEISTGIFKVIKKYYAGTTLATQPVIRYFSFDNFELLEAKSPDFSDKTTILKYPFYEGLSWLTQQDGRKLKFTIVNVNANAKTVSGDYTNCLKIQQEDLNLPGSYKYTYYAKDTGFVLITVGTAKRENRNSELISCKLKEQ